MKTQSVSIDTNCGAICYNAKRNRYLMSSGKASFWIADASFRKLNAYDRTDASTRTAQGNCCDDSYLFFPMSVAGDTSTIPSECEVYNWDGQYVKRFYIHTTSQHLEIESMFTIGSRTFAIFFPGTTIKGAYLYELIPYKKQ